MRIAIILKKKKRMCTDSIEDHLALIRRSAVRGSHRQMVPPFEKDYEMRSFQSQKKREKA
jgi:hypothetical protein